MSTADAAPRALDRRRSAIGRERKQIARAMAWAEEQASSCTTDAMRARLLEELLRRVAEIRSRGSPWPPAR